MLEAWKEEVGMEGVGSNVWMEIPGPKKKLLINVQYQDIEKAVGVLLDS